MLPRKVRRSGLTMPVVTRRFIEKAWTRGCDFIMLDLEDSVPANRKAQARTLIKDAIPLVAKGGAEVCVRINHDPAEEDLEAVVWPGLSRIKYPKTETAEEVRRIDGIVTRLEKERGIPEGSIELSFSIETALGVANGAEIAAASPRLREFGGGGGYDMSCDLGVEMFVGFDQFIYGRAEMELITRAAGQDMVKAVPFVPNATGSVSNADLALAEARASSQCGFRGSGGGLNPAVVEPHNQGYTPSSEDVGDARWVLEQFEILKSRDQAWMQVGERIIDKYEAAKAQETLLWAAQCAERDAEKSAAVAAAKKG